LWVSLGEVGRSEEKLDVEGALRGGVCTTTQDHEYTRVKENTYSDEFHRKGRKIADFDPLPCTVSKPSASKTPC
jgi:hypothetical protein